MIYAVGVNHHTAPVTVRECLHLTNEEIANFLHAHTGVLFREAGIVSTCNRTELYAVTEDEVDGERLIAELRTLRPAEKLRDEHFFRLFSCGAVSHLFKVAAAVDSQILGDMQILGQVKQSYELANGSDAVGSVLSHMFMGALHAGKRVRAETGIGIGAVSVSFAAVELARKIFSDLHRKSVLIIGSGETSALAARHLVSKGVERLTITNRTYERALPLAEELRAKVLRFETFSDVLADFDMIVSATAATEPVITREMVRVAMKKRQNRPLLILDLAVPRDVDPTVNELDNVFLKDLDAIQGIIDQNLEQRRQEVPKAEAIVTEEVVNFFLWYNTLDAAPTIAQLREKFEQVRAAEFERFRNKIDENSLENVEMLTRRIINKLLHPTIMGMKKPAHDSSALNTRIRLVRDLFDLEERRDDTDDQEFPADATPGRHEPQDRQ
ncbi:MAG: glutamyl-tRNA reductase [Bacteroidota bacterium]|jgi:glutamyl-tRNA reductase|nr:glutamyl-tRNA reductase [Bacteroidota bacterium]